MPKSHFARQLYRHDPKENRKICEKTVNFSALVMFNQSKIFCYIRKISGSFWVTVGEWMQMEVNCLAYPDRRR